MEDQMAEIFMGQLGCGVSKIHTVWLAMEQLETWKQKPNCPRNTANLVYLLPFLGYGFLVILWLLHH